MELAFFALTRTPSIGPSSAELIVPVSATPDAAPAASAPTATRGAHSTIATTAVAAIAHFGPTLPVVDSMGKLLVRTPDILESKFT